MVDIETLKLQNQITRQDIADLLSSIGPPGEKQEEKVATVAQLNKVNFQGHKIEDSLESYVEF